jgi:glutaredoxin
MTIYSSSRDCPWSWEVKCALRERNVEFEEYFPYHELAMHMVRHYRYPSFPQIWFDADFIGGWVEFWNLMQQPQGLPRDRTTGW